MLSQLPPGRPTVEQLAARVAAAFAGMAAPAAVAAPPKPAAPPPPPKTVRQQPADPPPDTLGGRIRCRRRELGLSVDDLAAKSATGKRYLNAIETDYVMPADMKLVAIARALSLPADSLIAVKRGAAPEGEVFHA